ncbi:MAG: glutaredoxin family protein [Betaproteobacteria bacterium]|nr:glutaredoxin family protein [Betaproteobacteria bacterium]
MKPTTLRPLLRLAALAWLTLASLSAWSQYKVVAPDGSVTYTDRPPFEGSMRITPIGRNAPAAAVAEVGLPIELRQAAARYPVMLYTSAECAPCDDGRKLLQKRGVPYAERTVATEDDVQALERLIGGRTVPALTIGAQPLRGFSEADWASYLDAAGYPKESKLPRTWPAAVPSPLVQRAVVASPAARPAPTPAPPPPVPEAPQPGTIRF